MRPVTYVWHKRVASEAQPGKRLSCFGTGFFVKMIGEKPAAFASVLSHNEDSVIVEWLEGFNGNACPEPMQQTIPMSQVTKVGSYWEAS